MAKYVKYTRPNGSNGLVEFAVPVAAKDVAHQLGIAENEWSELTQAEYDRERVKRQIEWELSRLDAQCIRPLRAIQLGTATEFEVNKLMQLENKAAELRAEIANL